MKSIGLSGQEEAFVNPLFQTLGMFVGMLAALVMHGAVLAFKIPFPGYNHVEKTEPIPSWMYYLLVIPSLFDLAATALCMFGLMHVNVSIYQMLRGGAIIFVALLKQFFLGDTLKKFMWVGVLWNVISIALVGATAMMSVSPGSDAEGGSDGSNEALLGVMLILLGAFVQSLQYAFEEKVMSMDIAAPPLLLIGMEGLWGTLVCLLVLYPLAYNIPGSDHGCIENPFNTYEKLKNSTSIQYMFVLYFFSIFFYNMLACLVTYTLNSVWHAILDNFRPVTVWGTDLVIYYMITTKFGESWTKWSNVELLGMFVLFYGTAIYNAPNAGSLKLTGGPWSLFMDFTDEYSELEELAEDERLDAEALLASGAKPPTPSSPFLGTMSPFMSPGRTRHRSMSGSGPRHTSEVEMLGRHHHRHREDGRAQQSEGYGSIN